MIKRKITIIITSFFLSLFANGTTANEAVQPNKPIQEIVLSGTNNTKHSHHGRWLQLIYAEVFKRLNIKFSYQSYPAKRASAMSDNGLSDGEIHRVYDYSEKHPNLIRVEEPHFSIHFSAYAIDPAIKLSGWESLRGKDYMVGHRIGVKKTQSKLPSIIPKRKLSGVINISQGLKMLQKNRLNLFIDVESVIESILLEDNTVRHLKVHRAGVMEKVTVHAFLHKKNKVLVEKIAVILKEMKKEGLINQYKQAAK